MQMHTMQLSAQVTLSGVETLASMPEPWSLEAQSMAASRDSVDLLCTEPLPVGQAVTLTFHLATQAGSVAETVRGRVTNVRFDEDASVLGIEFTPPLAPKTTPVLYGTIEGNHGQGKKAI